MCIRDRPDTRFGLELVDLTDVFSETDFNAFKAPCIKGIKVAGGGEIGRNQLDQLTDKAKTWGAKGLVWIKVGPSGEVNSPVAKFMSETEISDLVEKLEAEEGDICYLVADEWRQAVHVLGLLRLEVGRPPVNEGGFHFLWVIDFPLFEDVDDAGNPTPAHHPLTMQQKDDLDM